MLEYYYFSKDIIQFETKVFDKFLHVSEDFFQDNPSGNTINDTTTEVERASDAIVGSVKMLGLGIIFIGYIVMMLYLSTFFTLFAIVSFLIAIFFLKKFSLNPKRWEGL